MYMAAAPCSGRVATLSFQVVDFLIHPVQTYDSVYLHLLGIPAV